MMQPIEVFIAATFVYCILGVIIGTLMEMARDWKDPHISPYRFFIMMCFWLEVLIVMGFIHIIRVAKYYTKESK